MEAARSGSPGLDLDVLQLFAALMETGALHRAATRLDISQPMASRELNRMRAIFNDKLFIKAGAGMVPTARAVELQPAIADVLARMEAIVTPDRFDPAASRYLFRIAVADNGFLFFIGEIVPQLTRHAPHARLEVRQIDAEIFAHLREGQLDAAIFPAQKLPPDYHQRPLLQSDYVCLLRADHPLVLATPPGTAPDVAAFNRYGRIAYKANWGHDIRTSEQLALPSPLETEPMMLTPYFLGVPQLLVGSELIMIVPRPTAERFMSWLPLTLLPTPVPSLPFAPSLIWHDRTHTNPALQWFRSRFPSVAPK